MNTAAKVDQIIKDLKTEPISKAVFVVRLANACIGWTYIFGDRGTYCTASHRKSVYNSHPSYTNLIDKCQILKNGKSDCAGCRWFPGGRTRAFDCRGFTYWLFLQVGITINGAGATTQYDNDANWQQKGPIAEMPKNRVCCVFRYDSKTKKMEHTLLYDGEGHYIHCSGEVKKTDINKYGATHYAIPKGLYEENDKVVVIVKYAVVTGGSLNLRASKSTSSAKLASIPDKTKVILLEKDTTWCKVTYNNLTGYVLSKYLLFESNNHEDDDIKITLSRSTAEALYEALKLSLNK